ncbi:V-type ATP synthase subunit D [Nocardioides pacificus]
MTGTLHAPPGRAGRLWLQHRLAVARQGADLLDHKLRILRSERERLSLRRQRATERWTATSREAAGWLLRGALIGGERSVRLSGERRQAEVRVLWEQPMGVRYPAEAICEVPDPQPEAAPAGNAALVSATQAHQRALEAAVELAAVEAALRILEAEETVTRHRLRAIEHRWVPRLERALIAVQFALEEEEHADGVRLRWAAGRQRDSTPGRDRTGIS